jgi:hypothetical protein
MSRMGSRAKRYGRPISRIKAKKRYLLTKIYIFRTGWIESD